MDEKRKLVKSIERINDNRWDTWLCIEPACGKYNEVEGEIEHPWEEIKLIEQEILSVVNSEESNLFENKNGERRFKHATYMCACGDCPEKKEHWIVSIDNWWELE